MKERLFKGFHPDEDGTTEITLNGEKIKGYWVCWDMFGRTNTEIRVKTSGGYYTTYRVDFEHIIPETVSEYIGLTDKNGKKIFEGDLHEFKGRTFVVKYGYCYDADREENYFGWYFEDINKNGYCECFDGKESDYVNIIGNIHDNPELLEKGENKQ